MNSTNSKRHFFDSDIIYDIEPSHVYFLSSLFSYLVAARPHYNLQDNAMSCYEYWSGYFTALSDNIEHGSDKKLTIKLYNADYLFLRSVAYDSFINNWISGEEEKIESIFSDLEKIYNNKS